MLTKNTLLVMKQEKEVRRKGQKVKRKGKKNMGRLMMSCCSK
jgi:hypothetical protein